MNRLKSVFQRIARIVLYIIGITEFVVIGREQGGIGWPAVFQREHSVFHYGVDVVGSGSHLAVFLCLLNVGLVFNNDDGLAEIEMLRLGKL